MVSQFHRLSRLIPKGALCILTRLWSEQIILRGLNGSTRSVLLEGAPLSKTVITGFKPGGGDLYTTEGRNLATTLCQRSRPFYQRTDPGRAYNRGRRQRERQYPFSKRYSRQDRSRDSFGNPAHERCVCGGADR